jgi:hypothetical protein
MPASMPRMHTLELRMRRFRCGRRRRSGEGGRSRENYDNPGGEGGRN